MSTKIYGLLLVGGKSERMGEDKALLRINGQKNQLEHMVHLLDEVCSKTFVSLRNDQPFILPNASEAIFDAVPEIYGPLCGILSAMQKHPDAHWLVLACDLPNLKISVLNKLIQNFQMQESPDFIAYRSSYDDLPEPLCAIYPAGKAPELLNLAKEIGKFCPRKLLILKNANLIEQDDPHSLDNINTREDLKEHLSTTAS